MIYPAHEMSGLEKALDTVIHNVLEVKRNLLGLKRKMFIGKKELEFLVERASRLTRRTKQDYDTTKIIRSMRNKKYDI